MEENQIDTNKLYPIAFQDFFMLLNKLQDTAILTQLPQDSKKVCYVVREHLFLRAQVEIQHVRNSNDGKCLPFNSELLSFLSVERLRSRLASSIETLQLINKRNAELEKKKSEVEIRLKEEKRLLEIVEQEEDADKTIDIHLEGGVTAKIPNFLMPAEEKYRKLQQLKYVRLSQLNNFFANYFKKPRITNQNEDSPLFQMSSKVNSFPELLQNLITVYISNPLKYSRLDSTMWLPYIELLLNTGIIVRNPAYPMEVRLTQFIENDSTGISDI